MKKININNVGNINVGNINVGNINVGNIIFRLIISTLMLVSASLILITSSYALTDANIIWSDTGNTYKLTPKDNMFTENEYTIKAVEFPAPVRGEMTIDGGRRPERPVVPFVKLELYRDIINNSNPIDIFGLGIDDEYITSDKGLRITISGIPDSLSQDWVYEYYNPWVTIRIQKRSVPNIDIQINIQDGSGNGIDENKIKPGDSLRAEIHIKNTGEDTLNSLSISIDPDPLLLQNVIMTNTLKDTISQLNKDEERIIDVFLKVPLSLEEKEYEIRVNATGHDINYTFYNFNTSKIIKAKGGIEYIYVEKQIARSTTYLKQYDHVTLNIVNNGYMVVSNVKINDSIPDRLIFIKDGVIYDQTQFSFNKSSIGPSDSWAIDYDIKPTEPGIYILPKFDTTFSVGGKELAATSGEVGFRVFGPKVVLNKSAIDMGNGILEVLVKAKNIGNGFTKVIIEDNIPTNTVLMLGKTNLTTSLDPDDEKTMNYSIKLADKNISNLIWPPARANYYLDDWKFNTSSDEQYEEGHIVNEGRQLEGGTKVHIVVVPVVVPTEIPVVAVPTIEENQRQVVATIPAETPVKTPKPIPGFRIYELIFLLSIIIIFKKIR